MSRRPAYLRSKAGSYWLMFTFLAALVWLVYGFGCDFPLQSLVDNSELGGRVFQGKVEEITAQSSGIKAYYMRDESTPLVAVGVLFEGAGSAYDEQGKEGLAVLAAATMSNGAGIISAAKLQDEMAVKGIKIGFVADKDAFLATMTTPKNNLMQAEEFLRLILTKPRFEDSYTMAAKAQMLKSLEAEKENPAQELRLAFNQMIYADHPYGRNPQGTEQSVGALQRSDLVWFAKKKLGRNNLYIGIAGDLDREEAVQLVENVFGSLPQKVEAGSLAKADVDWQQPVLKIEREGGQNIAAFAVAGTCRTCADFYPLYIANYLFGGAGLSSRLNQQIREKEGLTYGGYSSLLLNDESNLMVAGFSATPDKYARAEELFKQEWSRVKSHGFTAEELQSAKNYLTASYNLRFASTAGIAEMLAYMQKYGLGADFLQKRNGFVEKVTLKELNETAAHYFTDEMLQAKIGMFNKGEN